MSMWWLLALWVAGSFVLAAVYGLGAAIGYRRGWEDHRACVQIPAVADDRGQSDSIGLASLDRW